MTPEQWQKVEEVLQAALDRSPEERAVFLDQVCRDDAELKNETASLLSAYDDAGDFIEQPAILQDAGILVGDQSERNVGREVGPYRIVECLGVGGMGEVYLAHDGRLNRFVALKLLPAYFASDDERLGRFQREARAASALNHPNILTIHEVGEAGDVRFIATEFIDGNTIHELIAQKDLPLEQILDIAIQVAFALSAAHAAGIVHRDIKPENIMRRTDGLVKILDFGIAKLMEQPPAQGREAGTTSQTETGAVVGTVGYMSPEQARGLPVDERTDIWSLGVVLYQMVAHRMPFAGATRMDTMVNILASEPAPLLPSAINSLPELQALERIIDKTLRKVKSDRYQTATEMLADLKSLRQELELRTMFQSKTISETVSEPSLYTKADNSFPQPLTSALLNSSALSSSGHTLKHQWLRRYAVLAFIAALLIAVVTGFLFHRSSSTPPRANAPNVTEATVNTGKLYLQMSAAEQLAFIEQQEQRISAMMGDRPVKLNAEAVSSIKRYVDRYAARTRSTSDEPGKEDLRVVYARAQPYLPLIARSFAARKVPVIIGIYLPMIESEYRPCFENSIGAKGLFQFLPRTATQYGVAHEDMCDVEQMAPAAAHYIADHMADLGDDAESMTLVLLSYNRGSTWVRSTLRQLRDTDNYERNFWTLLANRDKLDDSFRNESAGYIPMFFAAAIIGENPRNFQLDMAPLSTLTATASVIRP